MKKIVIASDNLGKLTEIGAILAPLDIEIVAQSTLGVPAASGWTVLAKLSTSVLVSVPELTAMRVQRHAVEALYHLTKTLDATRPVIGNDGWESSATDIIGIHDYDANTEHMRQRYGAEIQPEQLFDRRRPGGRGGSGSGR